MQKERMGSLTYTFLAKMSSIPVLKVSILQTVYSLAKSGTALHRRVRDL
jgi:hypothetical protein